MELQNWCAEHGFDVNNVKLIVTIYNHNLIDAIEADKRGPHLYRDVCRNERVSKIAMQKGEGFYTVSIKLMQAELDLTHAELKQWMETWLNQILGLQKDMHINTRPR